MYRVHMKPKIYLWKHFVRISPTPALENLEWLSKTENYYYFLPNKITRIKFINDIMPIIEQFTVDDETINYIYNIDLTHTIPQIAPLKEPEGIKLKSYQRKVLELMLAKDRFCAFLGPGTGKTLIAISWILSVKPKNALIVTPNRVIDQYRKECEKYITDTEIEIINYEKLRTDTPIYQKKWDVVIFDESHNLKEYSSLTNRKIRELLEADYIYMFSGTPQDHCRYEIMSQLAVLDIRFLPLKTDFVNRYFEINEYYQPTKEKRPEELSSMIADVTYMADTEDILTLPEAKFYEYEYKLHPAYYTLLKHRVLTKEELPELDEEEVVIADSPGSLMIKLQQMCSGIISSDKRTIKFHSDKLRALKECIQEKKINRGIIFTWFAEEQEDIQKMLTEEGYDCVCIRGETKRSDSDRIITEFKEGLYNFLILQAKCGGAGLDFKTIEHVIFYTLPTSYIVYVQCLYRIRRATTNHICHYHIILSNDRTKGVDRKTLESLKKKKSFNMRVFKNLM